MFLSMLRKWLRSSPQPARRRECPVSYRPRFELLERRLAPAIVVAVTNPFDEFDAYTGSPSVPPVGIDGLLSLREAIVLLNSVGGGTLTFAVPKVLVAGPLPAITAPVTIDIPLAPDGHSFVQIIGGGL